MIYLDSAATSLQKPLTVPRAVSCAITHLSSPGRGGYGPAQQAEEVIFSCREECGTLLGEENPENVIFTSSATHSLNIAIKSLVQSGSTVLISPWEHNAVTRPLHSMDNVSIRVANAPLFDQAATRAAFARCLTPEVDVVIFTHVSNVFGYVLPVEDLAILCRQRGVPFIIDASQSAGSLPINQEELQASFIAMPGHKGLLGPQGTGVLLCHSKRIATLMEGGTGSASRYKLMPKELPDRLEAGTANVCGIAGLRAGVRYLRQRGIVSIQSQEMKLSQYLGRSISDFATVFLAEDPTIQSGVLSFQMEGWDCQDLATTLGERGFAVRAGLHCAPLAHQSAGTLEEGTVRASVSPFTTKQEIDQFISCLSSLRK
ncbi:MAG: aminotransferase class V-fold PLP-dependent enzyme [Eubacteriales bacterium]